jgi:hypothetical protein
MIVYIAAIDEKDAIEGWKGYELHDTEESARRQIKEDSLENCSVYSIEIKLCLNKYSY